MDASTPVLIVGAGPVGMTAALLLSRLGIKTRIVERRASAQTAPAAHVVNARTLEIFRAAGIDMRAVAAACQDPADSGFALWVTTLAGRELGRLRYERQGDDCLALTPTPLRNLSQHRLEPILLDELRRCADVDVAFGHQWLSASQDDAGVTSTIRNLADGATTEIRSRWLIAADGAGSAVRRHLAITPIGPDRLQSFVMIHFEANLRALVGHRPGILYWTTAPGSAGAFVAHDIDSTWVFMHPWDPDTEAIADYTEAACTDIVRRAMGSKDHPFTIRTVRSWTMTAQLAERYRDRRIFLVGDAAHRFPPTGGLGLNTGVEDAHNLIWKIAASEAGWASDALLDSYEVERRPVAQHNADVSLHNAIRLAEVFRALAEEAESRGSADRDPTEDVSDGVRIAIENQAEHFDMLGLQLGFGYDVGALATDGQPQPRPGSVREYVPNAMPGSRVPHAWVERHGVRVSTLDLFRYDRFTLVIGPAGQGWPTLVNGRVPIDCIRIGEDITDGDDRWLKLLGIDAGGALLIRPDQHVAWRSIHPVADGAQELRGALRQILSAGTP